MLELEGQGGRAVLHLDGHARVTVAELDKRRGLKAKERIPHHDLILSGIPCWKLR